MDTLALATILICSIISFGVGTVYRRQLDIEIIKSNLDVLEKELNKENIEQFVQEINLDLEVVIED